ncbi:MULTISPECIES: hypothetical protein [unclassified Myroides]|uniref:hypothetical protein n=1 Tax=unclassified Myroides TaxID=2642485 RepID=UPI003D2F7315
MIQASELRLGNLVLVDNQRYHPKLKNVPVIVTGIEKKTLTSDQKQSFPFSDSSIRVMPTKGDLKGLEIGQLNEFIKPIELTEERLLQCGFRKNKTRSSVIYFLPIPNLRMEIHATFFHGQFIIELVNHVLPIVTEVRFLHQLQNLYFVLTEKELEIKL